MLVGWLLLENMFIARQALTRIRAQNAAVAPVANLSAWRVVSKVSPSTRIAEPRVHSKNKWKETLFWSYLNLERVSVRPSAVYENLRRVKTKTAVTIYLSININIRMRNLQKGAAYVALTIECLNCVVAIMEAEGVRFSKNVLVRIVSADIVLREVADCVRILNSTARWINIHTRHL